MISFVEEDGAEPVVDGFAAAAFLFFLLHLAGLGLYASNLYKPDNTFNPGWTAAFG